MAEGPGFLWDSQWAELDEVLRRNGLRPSDFEREATVSREGLFGPKALPVGRQRASLRHREYDDLWVEIRWDVRPSGPESDESAEPNAWIVELVPPTDRRPRSASAQSLRTSDFGEIVDAVAGWSRVVAVELDARLPSRQARQRAEREWSRSEGAELLAIPQVTGLIHSELPALVADGLRAAGVDEESVDAGVARILGDSTDLEEQLRIVPRSETENTIRAWLVPRLENYLVEEAFDAAKPVILAALRWMVKLPLA